MVVRNEIGRTKDDVFLSHATRVPAVDRIVKEILNEDPNRGIDPSEDAIKKVSVQNLKRWYEGF